MKISTTDNSALQFGRTLTLPPLINKTIRQAKRLVIGITGFTVLLFGIVLIFTPGPAVLVVPVGMGILASEFVWARKLLKQIKKTK